MSDLDEFGYSKDFKKCRLGDISHIEMGQSPDSRFVFGNPFLGYPFLQGNAEFGVVSPSAKFGCIQPAKLVKENDVLISVRAPAGDVNIADKNYCIGRGLAGIRIGDIAPTLSAKLIQHQSAKLRRVAQGTTFEAISKSDLQTLILRIPPSAELPVIAKVLDTLDTTIHQTEAIIEKLKQVKQGLLHDLLTRGVDANGELRPRYEQAPELYQASPLGWIPKDWIHTPLKNIFAEPTRNGLYKQSSFRGRGPLMVQMGGLFRGDSVDYSTASRVLVTGSEFVQFRLEIGDLLFARRSLTFEGAGLCVVVKNLPEQATFESSIVRARLDFSKALPEFVNSYLRGVRSSAQRRTFIRQVAVSGVSSADIAQFEIALPKLEEQRLIIDLYSAANQRIEREQEALKKLQQQKSALTDDLLTGRVRVTPLLPPELSA